MLAPPGGPDRQRRQPRTPGVHPRRRVPDLARPQPKRPGPPHPGPYQPLARQPPQHEQRSLRALLNWAINTGRSPQPLVLPRLHKVEGRRLTQHRRLELLRRVLDETAGPIRARVAASPASRFSTLNPPAAWSCSPSTTSSMKTTVSSSGSGHPPTPVPEPFADLLLRATAEATDGALGTNGYFPDALGGRFTHAVWPTRSETWASREQRAVPPRYANSSPRLPHPSSPSTGIPRQNHHPHRCSSRRFVEALRPQRPRTVTRTATAAENTNHSINGSCQSEGSQAARRRHQARKEAECRK